MATKPLKLRDRIKAFKRVKAKDLLPDPKNWKTHDDVQRRALQGIFAEVGIADAALVRETKKGLMLIDGHLRQEELEQLDPETPVPVLILDVTEKEAHKLLATMDRITALAGTDDDKLAELVAGLELKQEGLKDLLAKMESDVAAGGGGKSIPELYQVVVECHDEMDQQEVYDRLKGEGRKCRLLTV